MTICLLVFFVLNRQRLFVLPNLPLVCPLIPAKMAGVVKEVLTISYHRVFFLRTVAVEITIIATKVSGCLALVALSISSCLLQSTQGLIHSKNAQFVVSKAAIMRLTIWPKMDQHGKSRAAWNGIYF